MPKRSVGFVILILLALALAGGCGRDRQADRTVPEGKPSGLTDVQPPQPSSGETAAKVLFVIAPSMFRDEEYQLPLYVTFCGFACLENRSKMV
jgi:hypothetical protein